MERIRYSHRILIGLLVLAFARPMAVSAQAWSGILATGRAIDWANNNSGVRGGIPTTRTQCGSTISAYTGTAATINNAIAACGANKFVLLGSGSFHLSTGITFDGSSNVTLRGGGADQTKLIFTGADSCLGLFASICAPGPDQSYYAPGPPSHIVNWTAGYSQGTTVITLSATTGLSVGMYLVLDQLDDTSDPGDNLYVCSVGGVCVDQGGGGFARSLRGQRQMTKVTNISGGSVTISPGLHMPNWSSGRTPQAWWGGATGLIHGDGVENLTVDNSVNGTIGDVNGANDNGAIAFIFAYDCWIKGVRSIDAGSPYAHFRMYQVANVTIRDSYLTGSFADAGASTNYGIEWLGAWDYLDENNICQHRTSCHVSDGGSGGIIAYSFAIDAHFSLTPVFMQASNYSHEVGNGMILEEGNVATSLKGDNLHGTSNLFTYFRNRAYGFESGKTDETNPVKNYSNNRYYAYIGNVLGTVGYHTSYLSVDAVQKAIFVLGAASNDAVVARDTITNTSSVRWGNWDNVTNAVRWCGNSSDTGWSTTCGSASEIPTADSSYPNSVPSSETLPASFYLASQPPFWITPYGTPPYPAIGPEVTGGNVSNTGGHANKTPSQLCYENMATDSAYTGDPAGVKVFNADTCYNSAADSTAPVAGNSGTITPSGASSNALTLTWTKATDVDDVQGTLQYEVCQSASNNVTSVATCEAATIIRAFTADIATWNVSGLNPGTTYYFNVVVKDAAGNKTAYNPASQMTSGGSPHAGRSRITRR